MSGGRIAQARRGPLRNRSRTALFLGYHSLAVDGPPLLSLAPGRFADHLRILRERGWTAGTLADLRTLAAGGRTDRPRAFISFDDGYVDNYSEGLALLREHGWTALFFVLPPAVDDGGPLAWPRVAAERAAYPEVMRSMDWRMVDEMAAAGMEFGSHTLSHPALTEIGDEQLTQELLDSRRALERRVGSCTTLAYPFGDWDARVEAAAAAAGYEFAFTLPYRSQVTASDLSIPRLAIDHRDDARRFGLKVSAAGRALLLSRAKVAARWVRDAFAR